MNCSAWKALGSGLLNLLDCKSLTKLLISSGMDETAQAYACQSGGERCSRLSCSTQGWRVQVQQNCSFLDYHVLRKVRECRYNRTVLFLTIMFCARLENAGTKELFSSKLLCSAQGWRMQVQKNCSLLDCHVLHKVGEYRYKRTVLF